MAQNYSLTETCISSGELNAKTAPTLIAIKNLSRTNNYYFVGNTGAAPYSAADFSDAAVFVWQPVEEGVAGSYYLMKLDGTYMQATSSKDFGTVDGAAVFTTTNPTTAGTGSAYFNGDGDSQGYIVDEALLVRFVNAAGTWINVQNGDNGTPTYNSGSGGWTVHHVYAVEEAAVEPEPEPTSRLVLELTSEQIGTAPYQLSDEDAAKVFALSDMTVALKVTTPASMNNIRYALFCTSDPTQAANTDAKGTNSAYVAYGTSNQNIGYLASCKTGDRFTSGTIPLATEDVVLVYVISPTNNLFQLYMNGSLIKEWNNAHSDGFMSGYEIATPQMVKADYENANIYIGGGMTAEGTYEVFPGTITGVEVHNGVLSAEEIADIFATTEPEPETPFEVVAVTPSEAVTELSTITVEFSEEIAGEQDLMAMETIYVGSRTNACNFTVDGKVLTITLWTPITAPGEYALKVPASVGITRASNGEAVVIDGEYVFTVKEATVEPEPEVIPAANKSYTVVAEGHTTVSRPQWAINDEGTAFVSTGNTTVSTDAQKLFAFVTYEEAIYIYSISAKKFVMKDASLSDKNPDAVQLTELENGKFFFKFDADHNVNIGGSGQMTIDNWSAIDGGNQFTLTEASDFDAAEALALLSATPEPETPFEVVAVTPSEAVTELSTITVEFSEEIAGEQDLMALETIYVGSRTNACNFTVDGKVLTITLWTPITAAGEYGLYIPESVGITRKSNGEAVTMNGEITFTVEEAVVEPETFTVTAALFPTVEGDVTEIKGIRVEAGQGSALAELPTGWTLTNEAGDEFTMNIEWLYDYETILIMVNPAITEAGTYTLTIPAGSLKTEDGKECEAAEFSWTIKDPYMPYNNGTRTRTDRLIKGITLTGASGENSYALTADEQTQDYTDATAVAVFKVEAGEELTITFDKIGEWIHQFVFIDFDGDGFTASIAEGSEWAPAEDLVAYSFYNNDSSDDNYGWNSVGTSITGNDRSTPAVPAFKAPETIGTYRMRVKQDWCNIDPAGDADGKFEDFKTNGGQIIDVILEVVEETVIPVEPLNVVAVTPAENEVVNSLREITIEFDAEIAVKELNDTERISIDYGWGVLIGTTATVEGKLLKLVADTEITDNGTYPLTIPAGVVTRVSDGVAYEGGTFTFTVEKAAVVVEPLTVVAVTPAEAVETLETITIEFSDNVDVPATASGKFTIADADGNTVATLYAWDAAVDGKIVTLTLTEAITTAGEYTFSFAEGLVTRQGDGATCAYTCTITVTGVVGIDSIYGEAGESVIYDITGRKIEKITEGGIYIVNGKKVLVK